MMSSDFHLKATFSCVPIIFIASLTKGCHTACAQKYRFEGKHIPQLRSLVGIYFNAWYSAWLLEKTSDPHIYRDSFFVKFK